MKYGQRNPNKALINSLYVRHNEVPNLMHVLEDYEFSENRDDYTCMREQLVAEFIVR